MRTEPLSPERRRKNLRWMIALVAYFVLAFLSVVLLAPSLGFNAISFVFGVTMMAAALGAWAYFIIYRRIRRKRDGEGDDAAGGDG